MNRSLERLWTLPAASGGAVREEPHGYLDRAIVPGKPSASAVYLRMHGEIRLKGTWRPFKGEEVLHCRRGFIWRARMGLLSGCDALIGGVGTCVWKLLGLVPVVKAAGPDIDRSATGRWLAESILLPSMLRSESGAVWNGSRVTLQGFGESATLKLDTDPSGRLKEFSLQRWGNPDRRPFAYYPFGGIVEDEGRFGDYVIPTRLRVGWHSGTPDWSKGEFFRMTVDQAAFR